MELVLSCWRTMHSERSIGMALGPVPWSRVCTWAAHHGLDADATDLLWDVIRDLDADHLAAIAAKQKG